MLLVPADWQVGDTGRTLSAWCDKAAQPQGVTLAALAACCNLVQRPVHDPSHQQARPQVLQGCSETTLPGTSCSRQWGGEGLGGQLGHSPG